MLYSSTIPIACVQLAACSYISIVFTSYHHMLSHSHLRRKEIHQFSNFSEKRNVLKVDFRIQLLSRNYNHSFTSMCFHCRFILSYDFAISTKASNYMNEKKRKAPSLVGRHSLHFEWKTPKRRPTFLQCIIYAKIMKYAHNAFRKGRMLFRSLGQETSLEKRKSALFL